MADHARCPKCGHELLVNAPAGLCPVCLLRRTLESDHSTMSTDSQPPIPGKIGASPSASPGENGGRCDAPDLSPIVSHAGATASRYSEADAGDSDVTLSYCAARIGGPVEPLSSALDLEQLASTFTPGMVLQGRYVLDRELGRGAMGVVFLGRDNRLDRPVAIKAILPGESGWRARGSTTEKQIQDRFLQEAMIGANLTHPAIATVHDFGYHGETPFTVFEYVAGPTLYDVIKRSESLSLQEVRLIIGPLAQALDFAHSRFVVHRDLKPANVKATDQSHFKILDLGLATKFRHHADWSGFAGTPAYASPEQAEGLPCDGRTDQYALAVIAYELLTGHRPFQSRDPRELLLLHLSQIPPTPASLPPRVRDALSRALKKDPNDRFPTCQDFALALGCLFLGEAAPSPEILREGCARSGSGGLRGQLLFTMQTINTFPFCLLPWLRHIDPVAWLWRRLSTSLSYVALTDQFLWVNDDHQGVERWALRSLQSTRRFPMSRTISLRARGRSMKLFFPDREEASLWFEDILAASARAPEPDTGQELQTTPVAILSSRPHTRYEAICQVEALTQDRKSCRRAAQVHAAMAGADAIIEVREEVVPGFWRTMRHMTGTAVRVVGDAGRHEVAARWYADRLHALTLWTALLFSLYIIISHYPWDFANMAGGDGVALLIACIPMVFVAALRWLRWPQLATPTAAAIACVGSLPAAGGACLLAHAAWTSDWNLEFLEQGGRVGTRHGPFTLGLGFAIVLSATLVALLVATKYLKLYRDYRIMADTPRALRSPGRSLTERVLLTTIAAAFSGSLLYMAIRLEPDLADAHYNFGLALHGQGKLDGAVAEYRAAIRLNPELADAHYWLGHALRERGKVGEAIVEFRAAIGLKPDDGEWHYWLGWTLADQDMLGEGVVQYREAIRLKFDGAEAHYSLGAALARQGKLEQAIPEYREAIRLKPDHGEWHYWLGLTLGGQNKLEQAVAEYRDAIRLKFDGAEAHYWLGTALAMQGELEQAIPEYRQAIRLKPDFPDAHYRLGAALASQGKLEQAIAEYRQAIRLKPDDGEWHYCLALTLTQQDMLDEAVVQFREAIRRKFDGAEAHYWLGAALARQGKLEQAVAEYRETIRLDPDDARAYCYLGSALAQLRDFSGSLAMYRKGHELGSRRPGWRQPSAAWVAEAERLAALESRWPALRNGRPARDNQERLFFADLAYHRKHFATAARLWAEAFASDAKLLPAREASHAYDAARAAVLAAAGKGIDDPPPDDAAKAEFRARALDLLKAELAAWSRALDEEPAKSRPLVSRTLELWRADPDLTSVRDADALARLSEEDQRSWRVFWSDVDTLKDRAKASGPRK